MRFITVTSDTFLDSTCLLLESLRVWHDDPVRVYALEQKWTQQHAARLAPLDVEIELIPEPDIRHRHGGAGRPFHALWKLDVFLAQQQPFIYLDADMLILRPIDHIINETREIGWFSVLEGTRVGHYNQGPIAEATGIGPEAEQVRSFNTGVLGCNPTLHRDIFEQARHWGHSVQVSGVYFGDQGLVNLAWYKLRDQMPPDGGEAFNTGLALGGRVKLHVAILHFAGPHFVATGKSKAKCALDVWSAWPRGTNIIDLTETPFWKSLLPFPWEWPNHCTQPRYRDVVLRCREQSRSLPENQLIAVNTPWQAFLIDSAVLGRIRREWLKAAGDFARVPHEPTYHLNPYAKPRSAFTLTLDRLKHELRSRLPR